MKRIYEQSQWMVPNSKHPISDETLYAYAGYRYVTGTSPILINPEAPPFGKYMIGLSILLFSNEKVVNVISGIAALVLIYFITRRLSDSLAASVAVALTAINTLFTDQLIHAPQLEILQAVWLLAFLYLFLCWEKSKKWMTVILAGISLGLFLSTKVLAYNFGFLVVILGGFLLINKKNITSYLAPILTMVAIAVITFTATYASYFFHGGSLRGFVGTQKWIFLFYRSSGIDMVKTFGSYLTLILFNRWRFWSMGYPVISYDSWSILWLPVFIASFFASYKLFRRRKATIIVISYVVYNIFLLITPIFPRYLLLLFILADIVIPFGLSKSTSHEKK